MLTAGALRACWPLGLAFIRPGAAGIVLVIAVQFGLVTCIGVFNPVMATYRLEHTGKDQVARTLSAWSITSNVTIAAMTALWGVLASLTSPAPPSRSPVSWPWPRRSCSPATTTRGSPSRNWQRSHLTHRVAPPSPKARRVRSASRPPRP
jgi:hypothetical protein